ncbi:MAG TPA: oxygenase MpaB family protein, partial [Saprospiraceae bacterium]|nr:oxygenase MpaB family protein [Saprospiraceae bacterium]
FDVSLGQYDDATLGYPINQEDMVFAIHTFSLEIIEGLRTMKIEVTDEEAENYFQCWKLIGRGLGVDRRLEPANYADAMALQSLIYKRHFTLPNATGPVLSVALMNWFVSTVPLLGERLLITFIRDFNGPENYAVLTNNLKIDLGNTHPDLKAHLTDEMHFDEKESRPGLKPMDKGDLALDNFFLYFIKTLIRTERGGKNEPFRVGDGFSASWDLNQMQEKADTKFKVILLAIWLMVKKFFQFFKKKSN